MSLDILRPTVRSLVNRLVQGDYEAAVKQCAKSRLTSDDVHAVIRGYGRTLIPPPSEAFDVLDAVAVASAEVPTWSVRAPLWTAEEGRSDLSLELTITLMSGVPTVELDDIGVF